MPKSAEMLQGQTIKGQHTDEDWDVIERMEAKPEHTPGFFSVGYKVRNSSGDIAFAKASDVTAFLGSDRDPLVALTRMANAHMFERQILEVCHGNAMDRIITAIDYGSVDVINAGVRDIVFFLIFELADGDIRRHVISNEKFDFLFCVTILHNIFIATQQLHRAKVAHNDLKPANTLVIDRELQKVGDLGRATSDAHPAPHDAYPCAGDPQYAPPEQIYPDGDALPGFTRAEKRRVGDLYNLGSIIHFMLGARMVTPEVIRLMRPETRPRNMSGGSADSYAAALPYWRDAFDQLLDGIEGRGLAKFGPGVGREVSKLKGMIRQLCEPDANLRGHPLNRTGKQDKLGLDRYISELDALKKSLVIKSA